MTPPESKSDVAYHVNKLLEARNPRWACVNTAVEATSLNDRAFGRLLEQDRFLRDSVRAVSYTHLTLPTILRV